VLLGVANELPVAGEAAAVAVAEMLEDDGAGLAEAGIIRMDTSWQLQLF
jgi:hypothetical protein